MKNSARIRDAAKPPAGLSAEARRWWRKLATDYAIEDEAGRLLLETALRALDRLREAEEILARDGITIRDRWGQTKPHPACTIERDARAGMLTALRALNLDLEPLRDRVGRPAGR